MDSLPNSAGLFTGRQADDALLFPLLVGGTDLEEGTRKSKKNIKFLNLMFHDSSLIGDELTTLGALIVLSFKDQDRPE